MLHLIRFSETKQRINYQTKVDIDVAHRAIIRHYEVKATDLTSMKLPKNLISLIRSNEIVAFMNSCSADDLDILMKYAGDQAKFVYNNIPSRPVISLT